MSAKRSCRERTARSKDGMRGDSGVRYDMKRVGADNKKNDRWVPPYDRARHLPPVDGESQLHLPS